MTQRSRRMASTLGVAMASLLVACSTPDTTPAAQGAAPSQTRSGGSDSGTIVGSRIPSKSTDRLVRQTGAAGAAEMERSRPPNPGPKIN